MLPGQESEPFLEEFERDSDSKSALEHETGSCASSQLMYWRKNSTPTSPHCFGVLVFIATSLIWGILLLFMAQSSSSPDKYILQPGNSQFHNLTSDAKLLTCGRSPSEARAKGCRYDILSNHWVPGICMDQEAVAEYQSDGSWFGFADEQRTEVLTVDAMSEREFYWTSDRDHIFHCAMLWRKQYRAFFEERSNFDTLIADYEHTMHCSEFLTNMTDNGPDYWNKPIQTFVGYAGCWSKP
jgi:hypothetical protein